MEDQIFRLISEVLKIDDKKLRADCNNKDIWDSIQRVEVLFAFEDEFGIVFSEEELSELNTPQKVLEAVIRKVSQK